MVKASTKRRVENLEHQQWAYLAARDHGYEIYPQHPSREALSDALREHLHAGPYGEKLPANLIGKAAEKAAARVFGNIDAGHYPAPIMNREGGE